MEGTQIAHIHETAVRILAELGVRVGHAEMRDRLAGLGCGVAGERVHVPADVVAHALRAVPHRFELYGREVQAHVAVDAGGPSLCTNTAILPNIYDFETGQVRRSLRNDVATSTRVLDALSEVDVLYVSLLDATEMPPHLVTVTDFALTLANTTKPLVGPGLTNRREARAVIAMAAALRGGDRTALASRPPCAPFISAITPLRFNADATDALIELVEAGLPYMALTNAVMGLTAPNTIAGTLALGHAEMLAGIVLAYALRPGTPVVSFNTPNAADMRTLTSTTGGPETGLMRAGAVELARYCGIPSFAHGHTSSARLDVQAADEKSLNQLLIAQAQPSLMGGLGGLANVTLTSYETLVLDNERFGALRRIQQGIAVDDEHLAYEVITGLVHGGDVVSHPHTVHHLRSGEVWYPRLARRGGLINGRPEPLSTLESARSEARRLIEGHRVAPLREGVQQEIDKIIASYDEAESTPAPR
jgi:trimethylamine---corrinoid protein Co-methyltransferase